MCSTCQQSSQNFCKRCRLPGSVYEYSSLPFCQRSNASWRWTTSSLPDVGHNQEQRTRSFWAKRNFSSLQYDSKWSFLYNSWVPLLYMQLHWLISNSQSIILDVIFHYFGYSLYSFDVPYFDCGNHFTFHVEAGTESAYEPSGPSGRSLSRFL